MTHTTDFFASFKSKWGVLYPLVGGAIPVLLKMLNLLNDPLWARIALVSTVVVFMVIIGFAFLATEKVTSSLISADNRPMSSRRKIVPTWIKWTAVSVFPVALGVLLYAPSIHQSLAPVFILKHEVLKPQYAILGGKEYLSGDVSYPSGERPHYFMVGAFYSKFMIQKAARFKNATIEKIVIHDVKFRRLVENQIPVSMALPLYEDTLYLVDIDDPQLAGKNEFQCEHWFSKRDGEYDDRKFAAAGLENDDPSSIIVRIDAKTPGAYTFKIKLVVMAGGKIVDIPVTQYTVYYAPPPVVPDSVQEVGK